MTLLKHQYVWYLVSALTLVTLRFAIGMGMEVKSCDSLNFRVYFSNNTLQTIVLENCFQDVKVALKKEYSIKFLISPFPGGYTIKKSREGAKEKHVEPGDVVVEDHEGYQWAPAKENVLREV